MRKRIFYDEAYPVFFISEGIEDNDAVDGDNSYVVDVPEDLVKRAAAARKEYDAVHDAISKLLYDAKKDPPI